MRATDARRTRRGDARKSRERTTARASDLGRDARSAVAGQAPDLVEGRGCHIYDRELGQAQTGRRTIRRRAARRAPRGSVRVSRVRGRGGVMKRVSLIAAGLLAAVGWRRAQRGRPRMAWARPGQAKSSAAARHGRHQRQPEPPSEAGVPSRWSGPTTDETAPRRDRDDAERRGGPPPAPVAPAAATSTSTSTRPPPPTPVSRSTPPPAPVEPPGAGHRREHGGDQRRGRRGARQVPVRSLRRAAAVRPKPGPSRHGTPGPASARDCWWAAASRTSPTARCKT